MLSKNPFGGPIIGNCGCGIPGKKLGPGPEPPGPELELDEELNDDWVLINPPLPSLKINRKAIKLRIWGLSDWNWDGKIPVSCRF
jgi:hypothetical protein